MILKCTRKEKATYFAQCHIYIWNWTHVGTSEKFLSRPTRKFKFWVFLLDLQDSCNNNRPVIQNVPRGIPTYLVLHIRSTLLCLQYVYNKLGAKSSVHNYETYNRLGIYLGRQVQNRSFRISIFGLYMSLRRLAKSTYNFIFMYLVKYSISKRVLN